MPSRPARRLSVLATALLTVGLLAPTAVSAAPTGSAATFGQRGSASSDEGSMSAFATSPIAVRDLSDACPSGRVPSGGFTDVKGSPFAPAIDCLVWYAITYGKAWKSYAPTESVTRQQMAVFLHRMLEGLVLLPDAPAKSQFRDVPATGEAGRAINVLASPQIAELLGVRIVNGTTATTFDPGGRVTRAQMGSFIARTLEGVFEVYGVAIIDRGDCDGVFRDERLIPANHWDNVELLCAAGIVTGRKDGTYGPAADVTRGQMAAFLMRLMDVYVEAGVSVPPDFLADIYVDRGTGVTACSNTGRDGSAGKPFCSIQKGIDTAAAMRDRDVQVRVMPRPEPYAEELVVASGQAFQVNVGSATQDLVLVDGSVRVTGAHASDANWVAGFDILDEVVAVDVRSPGAVFLWENVLEAPTGVSVDQTGSTYIGNSEIIASVVGVDLVGTTLRSDLEGTFVEGTLFAPASHGFVLLPASVSAAVADAHLNAWLEWNGFPWGARLGKIDDRPGIVAATPRALSAVEPPRG